MGNSKRRIAVFTGNRAEYGLQYPILRAFDDHPDIEYHLIVSGAHLDENFGRTLEEIKNDGFVICAEVALDMEEDTLCATAQAIGSGIINISRVLDKVRPDILVVYADRFEGFAAVIAGTQINVPTAHIEGGDLTEGGALDDSVRHAMTKLAHIHFTTNQQSSNRILAMGEEAWRVHTVGLPVMDLIRDGNFAGPKEIVERYNLDLSRPIVLFTQHSVTTEFDQSVVQIKPPLSAIERLADENAQVIITYPNNDAGGQRIISQIRKLQEKNIRNVQVHRSLGRYYYHGMLGLCYDPKLRVVCAGNSSSGIKETPAFGCPTVNIGSRQKGRLRGNNVIDVDYNANDIFNSIKYALENNGFRRTCRNCENPYLITQTGVGNKIADILLNIPLDENILRKRMTLKGETRNGWYR